MNTPHALPIAVAAVATLGLSLSPRPAAQTGAAIALTGATIVDGSGGPPVSDGVVVIAGSRIAAVGPRAQVQIPAAATTVDARGRWIVPGFIDTNVHLSLYG